MAWLLYEMYYQLAGNMTVFWITAVSAIVGGIVGGIIAWRMHKKVYRMCDEIVEQIEAAE